MPSNQGVLCEPPLETERREVTQPLLLIQVPALTGVDRFDRPEAWTGRRFEPTRRRKRRLRREVRVAALALLFSVPMVGVFLRFWPSGASVERAGATLVASIPAVSEGGSIAEEPAIRSWVTITLEPAAGDWLPESEPPVVRPAGFLLPDHGSEEPAHAGG